ncbi:MAG: type IV secretion system DNA-binding domain-containing protein, partial [Chloroflexi bacterium]|nr:type IV secretion system DNA-binding domain-containing protein [Chloroflexota bacterium]
LVRQKVVNQNSFYQVAIRASVWASNPEQALKLEHRLESAMGQYAQVGGNSFAAGYDGLKGMGPWPLQMHAEKEHWMWLGPDEVAGLWHPPIVNEQVSPGFLPVRGVEIRSPDPKDVEGFYQIGRYFTSDGGSKPVRISATAMRHNIFCIGKPGAGKSTLMQHLCLAAMADEEQPAIIVVDPHGDLVNQMLGTIDPDVADRIRILDVGDQEYTMSFNPLDVQREGWTVVQVANSIVDIGRSLWSEYWGPRMQNPLKRGVQLLAAANEMRPQDACLGLSQLAAVLNADPDVRRQFIANELEGSRDQTMLARYFLDDYDALSKHFREQVIQPVLSKAYRFEEDPMLALFSCPQSKLDVGQVIRDRNVLVVNTGMNKYGAEISDFVGSLMVNVVLMELVRQGEKAPGRRVPVMVVIDEFQTYTGVAWADLIQQMRKYGGRMVLGTQSMASLRRQDRNIPEIILSGVYSLFGFNMNGDDADYISRLELSGDKGGPTADTLISLEPYKAYVRLERADGRMSRPFYFESAAPPEVDELLAERVRALRAEYSFPYEVAHQKAMEMLTYFDRYGVTVGTTGASSAMSPVPVGATSTLAASVLLPTKGRGAVDEDLLEQAGMPWDIGVVGEKEDAKGADPRKVILGKEIVDPDEWKEFMNISGGPANDGARRRG